MKEEEECEKVRKGWHSGSWRSLENNELVALRQLVLVTAVVLLAADSGRGWTDAERTTCWKRNRNRRDERRGASLLGFAE